MRPAIHEAGNPEGVTVQVVQQQAPPTHISKHNSMTRGIPTEQWATRARQAESDGVPVTRLGAERVIAVEALDAWLASKARVRERKKPVLQDDDAFRAAGLRVVKAVSR